MHPRSPPPPTFLFSEKAQQQRHQHNQQEQHSQYNPQQQQQQQQQHGTARVTTSTTSYDPSSSSEAAGATRGGSPPLPHGWGELRTSDGQPYYAYYPTGHVQWERPAPPESAQQDVRQPADEGQRSSSVEPAAVDGGGDSVAEIQGVSSGEREMGGSNDDSLLGLMEEDDKKGEVRMSQFGQETGRSICVQLWQAVDMTLALTQLHFLRLSPFRYILVKLRRIFLVPVTPLASNSIKLLTTVALREISCSLPLPPQTVKRHKTMRIV